MSLPTSLARQFPDVPPAEPILRPLDVVAEIEVGVARAEAQAETSGIQLTSVGFAPAPVAAGPLFPAATLGAMVVGAPHAHVLHPPSGPPPIPPTPLPAVGTVSLGTCVTVLINGQPVARCGDLGLAPSCCGIPPVFEVFTGSDHVFIGGSRAARMTDTTLHCAPVPSAAALARGPIAAMREAMMQSAQARLEVDQTSAGAVSAAKALAASTAAAQKAVDAAATAMTAAMGKDVAVPPGTPGNILIGSPNVMIGGVPTPGPGMPAGGMFKFVAGLKPRLSHWPSGPLQRGHARKAHPGPQNWLKIRAINGDERPIPGEPYEVIKPETGAVVHRGNLDGAGTAHIPDIEAGLYKVRFPERPARRVAKIEPANGTVTPGAGKDHWLKIRLLNKKKLPVPNEPFCIIDAASGALIRQGRLDKNGVARVTKLKPGTYKVHFPGRSGTRIKRIS